MVGTDPGRHWLPTLGDSGSTGGPITQYLMIWSLICKGRLLHLHKSLVWTYFQV